MTGSALTNTRGITSACGPETRSQRGPRAGLPNDRFGFSGESCETLQHLRVLLLPNKRGPGVRTGAQRSRGPRVSHFPEFSLAGKGASFDRALSALGSGKSSTLRPQRRDGETGCPRLSARDRPAPRRFPQGNPRVSYVHVAFTCRFAGLTRLLVTWRSAFQIAWLDATKTMRWVGHTHSTADSPSMMCTERSSRMI